jgi:quercetin dioxygenase-like cupin family protein
MLIVRNSEVVLEATPGGNRAGSVVTPSRGATEISVIRQTQRPGGSNPLHRHDREEAMTMLAGRITVSSDGQAQELLAGDTVVIPAGTAHQIANMGDETAEWLLIAPAGIRFFHADGDEARPAWAL